VFNDTRHPVYSYEKVSAGGCALYATYLKTIASCGSRAGGISVYDVELIAIAHQLQCSI
jgi:hypothetical protein